MKHHTKQKELFVMDDRQPGVDKLIESCYGWANHFYERLKATITDYHNQQLAIDDFVNMVQFYNGKIRQCIEAANLIDDTGRGGHYQAGHCPVCNEMPATIYEPCQCEAESGLPMPNIDVDSIFDEIPY